MNPSISQIIGGLFAAGMLLLIFGVPAYFILKWAYLQVHNHNVAFNYCAEHGYDDVSISRIYCIQSRENCTINVLNVKNCNSTNVWVRIPEKKNETQS